MARILITPEQMKQMANQFKQSSQESNSMVQRLGNTMRGAESEWQGMTSQRFYQDYQQWDQKMKEFVQLLDDIGVELNKIATGFEETDNRLASGR